MKYLKNKRILAVIIVLVLVVLGGFFVIGRKSTNAPASSLVEIAGLPTLTPEDIGMIVTVRPDKLAIMFNITKASDIEKVEYEIDYDKEFEGEIIPEGILGEMNIGKDGITKTDYRPFGTCSSGVCHYDKVVSDPKIVLKVTKKDGKTYQVEQDVKLK